MKQILSALVLLMPSFTLAQELTEYTRALNAFNAHDYDTAVPRLYSLAEHATDVLVKQQAQQHLAQALAQKGLPLAAAIHAAEIVKTGTAHPAYLEAVQLLTELQEKLDDPFLIPAVLDTEPQDAWKALPPLMLARIHYLVATRRLRGDQLQGARELLLTVPQESPLYAKARYLLGVAVSNPHYPAGPRPKEAMAAFREVVNLGDRHQQELEKVRQLAMLGLGRMYYAEGDYAQAVAFYEQVPRFSPFWSQALFENGFARFRNEDPGGALGSLQALHAPQFEGAFQPESWILKATVYHFACLFPESKASLEAFEHRYLPMAEALKPLVETPTDDFAADYARVASPQGGGLPRPVLLWVRANERLEGVMDLIREVDEEKQRLRANPAWRDTPVATELSSDLEQNRQTLVQTAGKLVRNRLTEAYQLIRKFNSDADLIRLETTLAQKRLLEQGVDQRKLLAAQSLHRPAMPAENWNYWQFQGEFWIDEIGYYQYTFKRGCPVLEGSAGHGASETAPAPRPP